MRKPIYDFVKRSNKRHKIGWMLFAIAVIIAAYLIHTKEENVLLIIISSSLGFIGWMLGFITERDIADSFRLRKSESDYFLLKKIKLFSKKSKENKQP